MKRYALVIGIGKYANLNELSKPASDAQAVAEVLKKHGDFQEVILLNGSKAKPGWIDYEALDAALTKFLKQAATQDALIYFTGHGFTVEESEFDQRGYLATSSSKVKFKGKQIISQEEGFSFNKLNGLVQKASLSSLLLLLDCCHSGFLIEDDLVKQSLQAFSKSNYFLISACRSFQEAYALKRESHSVFTGALLESLLQENAKQGVVTALNVLDFIDRELKSSGQEPIFLGMGGAIPIVRYQMVAEVEPDETCPYQGLEAFTEETAQFFFGRQKDVEALWQKLEQSNFVPVIGASGSGKSSLVRAGLIPVLKQSGTNWVVLEPMKPGLKPLQSLEETLESLFQGVEKQRLLDRCINDEDSQGLLPLVEALPQEQRVLLVVDQFEEVFTVSKLTQSRRFIALLCQIADIPSSRLASVITMRADFVESCLHDEGLKNLIQTQAVYLSPLAGSDLTDAIAKPVAKQGYRLTSDLLAEIVKDTREEPGFLPLLQFALTKLWEFRDSQAHQLTSAAYASIGKLAGALDAHANQIYECREYIDPYTGEINLSAEANRSQIEQDWIRAIMLRLVRPGEGEKDTRQYQLRSTLVDLTGKEAAEQQMGLVLESLIKGRLLVSERETIDLAHEALIKGWKRLDSWCQESRELRRLSQRLEAARLEWEKDQQNPNLKPAEKDRNLMMGGLLAEVREQWEALVPYLQDGKDESFWQRSDAHEQDQIATLQRALTESRLRELAARAQYLVLVQARTGLELAAQAMGENLEQFPAQILSTVQGSLNQAMNLARISTKLVGHKASVSSVAFSPDGSRIVSGSHDKTIRLWDLAGNPMGQPFQGHESAVLSVAFSPDGSRIVSGSRDNTIRLWDLAGNPIGQLFQGHEFAVLSVAFSPDGTRIVSGSRDNTIRLWDLAGNPMGQPFQGHEDGVWSVTFSPDGSRIVSGSRDNTIRLWDLAGNSMGQPFQGHKSYVRSVAFSPDGSRIVSGSKDKTIRLWDLAGNPIGQPFQGHEDGVLSVAFSPDGTRIVSGSGDKTIRLWDLAGSFIGQPFQGHESAVYSVAFSPVDASLPTGIGSRIVSGSRDNTIRLWDLAGNPIGQPFQGHESAVWSVAFSPDGSRIVSGSDDKTIRLWDLAGNPIGQPFQGHESAVRSVAFSPDGSRIVSGSGDKTIRLWDLAGNPIGQPFQGHESAVWSVAFSPDGSRIVSGSKDKTIRLWDLAGNPIGQPFQGHESAVWSVAFSPDGTRIVSGSRDNTIRLWRGHWQAWLDVCCQRLGYHLVSEDPELEITAADPSAVLRSNDPTITSTQKACAACQKYVWAEEPRRQELAKMLRRQSNDLARSGKSELAVAKLRQATAYDPNLLPELQQLENAL